MKIFIKNMVSFRCKKLVESALDILNIAYESVELGLIETKHNVSLLQHTLLNDILKRYELEIIYDKTAITIEKIKTLIFKRIAGISESNDDTFATYLSAQLNYDYHYLSKLFSATQGITLHQFIILQKIEKVKELLLLKEFNISEIADQLNYSSISHLSLQFKKITGITPSAFKINQNYNRLSFQDVK